jgi:hypothetical protein
MLAGPNLSYMTVMLLKMRASQRLTLLTSTGEAVKYLANVLLDNLLGTNTGFGKNGIYIYVKGNPQ